MTMTTDRYSCRRGFLYALSMMSLAIIAVPARGDVITYDNGPPLYTPVSEQGAWIADTAGLNSIEAADEFTLAPGNNRIYNIHWWGVYKSGVIIPPTDDFKIKIYNDNTAIKGAPAPAPNTVNQNVNIISLIRTPTGALVEGLPVYEYNAWVRGFGVNPPYVSILGGNFRSWLGISNNSGGNDWAWVQNADSGGTMYLKSASTQEWIATNKNLAFYFSVVPEPSTWVMVVLSGLGVASVVARRKRLTPRR